MKAKPSNRQINPPAGRNKKDIWYKLDLSATVYPTLQRRDFSSVYRLSVTLKEEITFGVKSEEGLAKPSRVPFYKV